SPTLILLDLSLPKVPGDRILPDIRQLPVYQATPIVVLSAAPKEIEEGPCLHLGATAYVQKSSNFYVYFDSLKAIARTWLRHGGTAEGVSSPARREGERVRRRIPRIPAAHSTTTRPPGAPRKGKAALSAKRGQ